jgi:DNA-binding CsgD family transcriptional regulator
MSTRLPMRKRRAAGRGSRLAVTASGKSVPLGRMAALIGKIGLPAFERYFLRFVQDIVPSDHFVAYVYGGNDDLLGMMAASRGTNELARRNCLVVRDRYRCGKLRPIKPLKGGVLHRHWEQVPDPRIRREGYQKFGILDRLSVSCAFGGGFIFWSLYRDRRSSYFADADRAQLEKIADVLSAALARHAAIGALSIPCAIDDDKRDALRARFGLRGTRLSGREQQVYFGLIEGKTSDAMARELGLKLTTVLTYRRRLYKKFGVTTQRALVARVIVADAWPATAH